MDAPLPDAGLDALRRDLLAGLLALEERVRRHVDERVGESAAETRRYVDERVGAGMTELRDAIRTSTAETRDYVRESAVETRRYIDGRLTESAVETRWYIDGRLAESTAETRRHSGVVAESLMTKIELVAEGVRANGERVDRFQGEVHGQFAQVDRRLLRLRARQPRRRRS
jgi:hypothetical protein